MAAAITLVLGGTRSGKSEVAERLAAGLGGPVTYLATAEERPGDAEWATRLARHRDRRPSAWRTVELDQPASLPGLVADAPGTLLVDSLGTWLARHRLLAADGPALCAALRRRAGDGRSAVVVSEEVGLGVHPATALGRRFADRLGQLNVSVAAVADRVLLVVAGRVLELGPAG